MQKKLNILTNKFVILGLVMICGGGAIFAMANQPAKGTVNNSLSASDLDRMRQSTTPNSKREQELNKLATTAKSIEAHDPSGENTYDGDLFSFSYPATYTTKEHTTAQSGDLEKIILSATDPVSKVIIADVTQTHETTLNNISAIIFRRSKKDVYKEAPLTIAGRLGLAFTAITDDGFEKIGFFLDNGKLTSFVFTSHAQSDLSDEFMSVFKTFHWKQ